MNKSIPSKGYFYIRTSLFTILCILSWLDEYYGSKQLTTIQMSARWAEESMKKPMTQGTVMSFVIGSNTFSWSQNFSTAQPSLHLDLLEGKVASLKEACVLKYRLKLMGISFRDNTSGMVYSIKRRDPRKGPGKFPKFIRERRVHPEIGKIVTCNL